MEGVNIEDLEKLLSIVPLGILLMDSTGNIYYKNKKASDVLDMYSKMQEGSNILLDLLKALVSNPNKKIVMSDNSEFFVRLLPLDNTIGNKKYGMIFYDKEFMDNYIANVNLTEYESILDSTQDAIFIDDMHGNTEWINKACEQLYEVKREDIIGENIDDLEKAGIFSPSVAKLVLKSKEQVSIMHSNKSGKKILTTGTPVFDSKRKIFRVISTSRDITELVSLRNQLEDYQNKLGELREQQLENIGDFIVKSEKMKEVAYLAKRLAQIDSTVLITGESGVGKGEIAKYIHMSGDRKDMPFVKVNCGAIPESLLESELFGYEYGAFTGSKKQGKIGLFQMAQSGTILLDEISELPLNLQVKILHVIQDKEIKMVGGLKSISVDVRIIAATNRDLLAMVREKKFREDLFYRLNVVPIYIQPLRERAEDIIPLTRYFLDKYNKKFNAKKRIDPNTMASLIKYSWPGNVRELENIIERLVIITCDDTILPQNLPNYIIEKADNSLDIAIPPVVSLKDATEEVERQIILNTVKKYKTTREVAKALKVSQPTIVRKMSKYHINDANMYLLD